MNQTNTDKYLQGLQFIRENFPSVKGALIGGPTYLLIISSKDDEILQFYMISLIFSCFYSE